ncbi:MAG: hypothetical protein H0T95_13750 [Chthoniobacterales bacterium]|nr:hypothetical protein [Chthoniobacterales bacterium]
MTPRVRDARIAAVSHGSTRNGDATPSLQKSALLDTDGLALQLLENMLKLQRLFGSGEKLGPESFLCGRLFTAEGGHGTEYAKFMRASFNAVRTPQSAGEAHKQVDELATRRVNAIKGVLEAGVPSYPFPRMNIDILAAVVAEAHAKNCLSKFTPAMPPTWTMR